MTPVELRPFDLFLVAVLVAGLPLWAMQKFRRLRSSLRAGRPDARLSAYRNIVVVQWSLLILLLVHWALTHRSFAEMRFALPLDSRLLGGLLIAGAGMVLLVLQLRSVTADAESRRQAWDALGPLRAILPHTPLEAAWFRGVSITAGVCEEALYRGFLPWVQESMLPTPAAFGIAVLAFGAGHAYQGVGGVVKTSILGAVMALLTWLTGSLIPAVLLHAAIDLLNGELAYRVLRAPPASVVAEGAAPDPEDEGAGPGTEADTDAAEAPGPDTDTDDAAGTGDDTPDRDERR